MVWVSCPVNILKVLHDFCIDHVAYVGMLCAASFQVIAFSSPDFEYSLFWCFDVEFRLFVRANAFFGHIFVFGVLGMHGNVVKLKIKSPDPVAARKVREEFLREPIQEGSESPNQQNFAKQLTCTHKTLGLLLLATWHGRHIEPGMCVRASNRLLSFPPQKTAAHP